MKVIIDTQRNSNVRIVEIKTIEDWMAIVRDLDSKAQAPYTFCGPFKLPALVILGNSPINALSAKKAVINVEFVYDYEVATEQRVSLKAA